MVAPKAPAVSPQPPMRRPDQYKAEARADEQSAAALRKSRKSGGTATRTAGGLRMNRPTGGVVKRPVRRGARPSSGR